MEDFKGRQFKDYIILQCIRWYCKYGISYRDLEEMMLERGIEVDHTTIFRWVQRYAPELDKRLKWYNNSGSYGSWRVDETYIKVKGVGKYLYRAVDSNGNTIDFYLSHTRNSAAAKRFLGKCLRRFKVYERPQVINTDKNAAYTKAINQLKQEGILAEDTLHRKTKYLNNIVEQDHGKLKRLIHPVRGFKSMKTAYATIKGFEVMRMFKKGQFGIWIGFPGTLKERLEGEIRLIAKQFNCYDSQPTF